MPSLVDASPSEQAGISANAAHCPTISMCKNCSTTSRYPGSRILTSLDGRSARGRAAETAARPPTRTKSSISVVTNRTLKQGPLLGHRHNHARKVPVSLQCKRRTESATKTQWLWYCHAGNRFPGIAPALRVLRAAKEYISSGSLG